MSTTAIIGGWIEPIWANGRPAPPFNGTIVLRDGVIEALGEDVVAPADARVVDAAGCVVTPGCVEAHGHIGIWEEGVGVEGNDVNEGTAPATAGLRAIDGINIDDDGFRDALRGGVTAVVIKPGSGNVIGGQSVAIKTWGGLTIDDQVIRAEVSVKSALGENPKRFHGERDRLPSTRMGVAYVLRNALVEAANYAAARAAAEAEGKPFARDLAKETLARVLDGELVWDQHVHRHDDLATALRLQREFGFRLVVNHGTEGGRLAPVLAERDIPVIYGPVLTSRSKVELRERGVDQLLRLAEAGVRLALTTDHPVVPIEHFVLQAQVAVRDGLDPRRALEALTINPASFLGLDGRIGSLEPGKDADIVVWSRPPLELDARPRVVLIEGREVYRRDPDGTAVIAERF